MKQSWYVFLDTLIEPRAALLDDLVARGKAEVEHPAQTVRALSVLSDRYLIDIYGRSSEVPIEEPVAVLAQIWSRTLRLR